MFTGLIRGIGTVSRVAESDGGGRRLHIRAPRMGRTPLEVGASLSVSGVCLTIISQHGDGSVAVDVSARTLADTALGDWSAGRRVNLEPALAAGDALGGHFVTGHVDGVAEVARRREQGRSVILDLSAAPGFMRFIASKGSVALDGASLTVNDAGANGFSVNLIPHTLQETTLSDCSEGSRLNLEVDLIARYAAKLLAQ
ncbi:MAG: riboflavin synthase [Gammaproteobacteria bacterium]|nr:riboflavin synthase [Gammaproteobacteria bacterium]